MNAWLLKAPWWALSLVLGLLVGLLRFGGAMVLRDKDVPEAAISAVIGGVVFGLVMGPVMARRNRRTREALGTDDPDVIRRAARAARRGPVPADPTLREGARRMAELQREQLVRQRRWAVPFSVLVIAAAVYLAIAVSPAGWVLAAVFAVLLAMLLALPRRLERRAELLADPAAREP